MTSLEIAELTGKQHFHVMEAIRKMEPAWKKVCKSNFRLTSRTIVQPNGGTREVPCYQLTKTECLYIATKFNDEARARLVLRWEELEMADVRRKMADARCLPEPKKILALADEIIGEGLRQLNEDAEDTLTETQVAKTFNMSVYDFNCVLRDMGIQY
ncbi:Phage regulatory protein Rha (Phage_pRha) [Prevotella sp. tc2-28]|nr:Phage regulatory protein Rha (Phage_pRha) [Prevotella sp. tc2-28]